MRNLRFALIASAVALAFGTSAHAQSGFYFFGDSLTDAGSYAPLLPPGTGRFTTNPDPVWAQILGERYGFVIAPANQGGTDYAQGGARMTLLPGVPNSPPTGTALPIANQVMQQIGKGIDPNAIYLLWGGGNDVLHQLGLAQVGAITPEQAQAAVALAATQYVQQVAALRAAGAQNIVVINLPDGSRSPAGIAAGPAAAAQIAAITNLYNGIVQSGLDALGGNVLRVDVHALFGAVLANPQAFGISNVTTPACGTVVSLLCTRANLIAPDANRTHLFADDRHPSGAGHELIAGFVASLLEAPFGVAALTEGPLAVEQSTFRSVDARMWSALNTPLAPKGFNLWTSYDYASPDIEIGFARGDADLHTFSIGGDIRVSQHLVAGAAAHFSEYKASLGGGGHKLEETSATIYAGWGSGPWFAGASLLIGTLDFKDVRRSFDLASVTQSSRGDASGTHWALRMLGGYWMQSGTLLHGPFAKLVYQEADVDSFSEPAGATALRYGEQNRDSLIASLGWQVQGQWGAVRPFGRLTWEYEFKDELPTVSASPVGLGGTFATSFRKPDNNWALLNVGASMDFGARTATMGPVSGYLMGSATAGKDDGDSYSVTIGIRVPL